MPNQPWKKLNVLDREIRAANPVGMEEGTKLVIKRICGFELFNTRAYHNYETWSDGYSVCGRRDGEAMKKEEVLAILFDQVTPDREVYVWHSGEDLDEAIAGFHKKQGRPELPR